MLKITALTKLLSTALSWVGFAYSTYQDRQQQGRRDANQDNPSQAFANKFGSATNNSVREQSTDSPVQANSPAPGVDTDQQRRH